MQFTPEQEAQIAVTQDKWHEISISSTTEPIDKAKVEAIITRAYREAKLEPPKKFVYMPSPLHGALATAILLNKPALVNTIESLDVVEYGKKHKGELGKQLTGDLLYMCSYGTLDAAWLAFYDFFLNVIQMPEVECLRPLIELTPFIGLWWPFDDVVIITPKPSALHVDDGGRLHNTDGPAVDYNGTYQVYAWHGTLINRNIIDHPEDITAKRILAEPNTEIARIMVEKMGLERFYDEANPAVLDEDQDIYTIENYTPWAKDVLAEMGVAVMGTLRQHNIHVDGTLVKDNSLNWIPPYLHDMGLGTTMDEIKLNRRLLSINMPSDPDRRIVVVEVECPSTNEKALLRVPPTIKTCREGIAWTYSMTQDEYHPDVET